MFKFFCYLPIAFHPQQKNNTKLIINHILFHNKVSTSVEAYQNERVFPVLDNFQQKFYLDIDGMKIALMI